MACVAFNQRKMSRKLYEMTNRDDATHLLHFLFRSNFNKKTRRAPNPNKGTNFMTVSVLYSIITYKNFYFRSVCPRCLCKHIPGIVTLQNQSCYGGNVPKIILKRLLCPFR